MEGQQGQGQGQQPPAANKKRPMDQQQDQGQGQGQGQGQSQKQEAGAGNDPNPKKRPLRLSPDMPPEQIIEEATKIGESGDELTKEELAIQLGAMQKLAAANKALAEENKQKEAELERTKRVAESSLADTQNKLVKVTKRLLRTLKQAANERRAPFDEKAEEKSVLEMSQPNEDQLANLKTGMQHALVVDASNSTRAANAAAGNNGATQKATYQHQLAVLQAHNSGIALNLLEWTAEKLDQLAGTVFGTDASATGGGQRVKSFRDMVNEAGSTGAPPASGPFYPSSTGTGNQSQAPQQSVEHNASRSSTAGTGSTAQDREAQLKKDFTKWIASQGTPGVTYDANTRRLNYEWR